MKNNIKDFNIRKKDTRLAGKTDLGVSKISWKIDDEPAIRKIYNHLFALYGPQGWWPLIELHEAEGKNPTKTGSIQGYHPADYTYPQTKNQQFEIICGALLTQNTSWIQVEKALLNLKQIHSLSPASILALDLETLKEVIRPAGYYNQKSMRLKALASWFLKLGARIPLREELLSLKGVGPETADSILLYAFKQPFFVVDAYTKRIVTNLSLASDKATYNEIKALFEDNLPEDFIVYQECHALLVEHAKRYYQKKECRINDIILKHIL
jgi:endonuclease III related protein